MSRPEILTLIKAEIVKLEQAYVLLTTAGKKRPGRPKAVTVSKDKRAKKRKLSPEARARIVAAVKARWAKQKAANK